MSDYNRNEMSPEELQDSTSLPLAANSAPRIYNRRERDTESHVPSYSPTGGGNTLDGSVSQTSSSAFNMNSPPYVRRDKRVEKPKAKINQDMADVMKTGNTL